MYRVYSDDLQAHVLLMGMSRMCALQAFGLAVLMGRAGLVIPAQDPVQLPAEAQCWLTLSYADHAYVHCRLLGWQC